MSDVGETPFWHHAAGAASFRVLLAAAGLDTYLECRIEVGTPVTASIRYREGAQLLALGLSPYAGAAFHGPPLLLAGAQAVDALGRKALGPGFSVLAAPWRTLATSAVDVVAAAALAALARTAAPPGKARSVAPATIAALYLWNPLSIAAAVGGSPAGLENAAVFGALAAAAAGDAATAGLALAAAAYMGLHPILLTVAVAMLLLRGPEPLHLLPLPLPQLPLGGAATLDAAGAAVQQPPSATPASYGAIGSPEQLTVKASADAGVGLAGRSLQSISDNACFGSPLELSRLQSLDPSAGAATDTPAAAAAAATATAAAVPHNKAEPAGQGSEVTAGARVLFQRQFRRRRRRRGGRLAASFLLWLAAWAAVLALASDLTLRQFPEHRCSSVLRLLPSGGGAAECAPVPASAGRQLGQDQHWTTATYGFMLTVADLTPNLGLHWYFFAEMFAHFRPFWHFVFHAAAAATAVPLALRLPHRPLLLALVQCVADALLKPYPSVGDVAQYLALLPLFAPQLAGGGAPAGFLAASFALLAGLGPAMWHMWIYLGSANANFYYAITLLFGAWQALLALAVVAATLRFDRLLAGKTLERW